MAEVRPFRALRYDTTRTDPALVIAPPYDVISPLQQTALYQRSPYNVVRIEYGHELDDDAASQNRYTRARADLSEWTRSGALIRDAMPALYVYRQEFVSDGKTHARNAVFGAVRLEEWAKGIVKPHEHTLAGPKADRLALLRETRTQISPVFCLYRPRASAPAPTLRGDLLYDFSADGQRHILHAVTDERETSKFSDLIERSDVYIADGHHRYETALAYRDEMRAKAAAWSGVEAANRVLMALTDATDPGLLVLPTHRLVHRPPSDSSWRAIERYFDVAPAVRAEMLKRLAECAATDTCFGMLTAEGARLLSLRDRSAVEGSMPDSQPPQWKRLDVNVLQYGVLAPAFGIGPAELTGGGAVTYVQDADEASTAVSRGDAGAAFLLNATRAEQVMAVADAGGRMPQKSTYFYPKLPTGLVMNVLD